MKYVKIRKKRGRNLYYTRASFVNENTRGTEDKTVDCYKLVFTGLLHIGRVDTNFFVILLKGSKILTRLREFTLLHTLTDVPVHKGTLGVQEVELMVKAAPCGRDGSRVRQHAHATRDLSKVTPGMYAGGSLQIPSLKPVGHQSTN